MILAALTAGLLPLLAPDPRGYAGPEQVEARPAGAPGWPASAGPAPGTGPVPEDRSTGAGGAGPGPVPEDRSTTAREGGVGAAPVPGDRSSGAAAVPGGTEGAPREVRYIEVTTDLLGRSTRLDVQRHAGGRSIVKVEDARETGSASMAEVLDKVPGVRAVEGVSGTSTSATKLNVAVRGASPRLSEQATVMLDEVPIAPAPYGSPSLSLFPLSLFQIAAVDTVRGGSSVRFGPWTSGGVFNLVSHPIPQNPTVSVAGQVDQFGDAGTAASYGGTHRGIGVYAEYAPRFGRTYREHSEFQSHGGILKLRFPIGRRVVLESSSHVFWEQTNLPGGLTRDQYAEDRYQSRRPHDRFDGHREGTNLKLRWQPRVDHELQVIAFYSHTFRRSIVATNEDNNLSAPPMHLRSQPRLFDVFGVEPRYALRIRHKKLFQDVSVGLRGIFESGAIREYWLSYPAVPAEPRGGGRGCPRGLELEPWQAARRCLDGRTGGYALYLEDKLYLLDTRLVITGGIRLEVMQQKFYNRLDGETIRNPPLLGPLPAFSIWYGLDQVAGYLGYGRSFGAPGYYAASIGNQNMPKAGLGLLVPETADMLEGGVKLMELGGVYAEVSLWYKHFRTLRDEGDNSVDIIPAAHAGGVEAEVEWLPGEVWERVEGLELLAGYAYTGSRVRRHLYAGNRLPWYPVHEAWGAASYKFPFGLKLGTRVDYTGAQFSDYANWPNYDWETGEKGVMPAYTLMSAFAGVQTALPRDWRIDLTVGVKNLLNYEWFTRTDDLNGGILGMRPRTFYLNLAVAHEFIRSKSAEQARRRAPRPDRRRWTSTARREQRLLHRVLGPAFGGWL